MSKKAKKDLGRLILSIAILAVLMILDALGFIPSMEGYNFLKLGLYIIPYFIAGYDVVFTAIRNIFRGRIFDENFLMFIASLGAMVVGEFAEGAAVVIFYEVGEFFQDMAVAKSRRSIKELMDIAPVEANVLKNGEIVTIDPEEVRAGDILLVRPGEKVAVDGIVIEGETFLDTSSLTGESVPRAARLDDEVISGCINKTGTIKIRAEKEYEDSTVAKILELVENAGARKGKTEKFITKFAKYYTPIVVATAIILFLIPSIITADWMEWLERACTFLVVSCPCALVISVPLAFFAGIGKASRLGILIKGGVYIESAAKMDTVVFDKTGTLTRGIFKIKEINPAEGVSKEEVLRLAAHAEEMSVHPIAESIKKGYIEAGGKVNLADISEGVETPGKGISASVEGKTVLAGNADFMEANDIEYDLSTEFGTICHIACGGKYMGNIVISDILKAEAGEAIESLKSLNIKTVMLTGDRRVAAEHVAKELGIDQVYSDLLPADKVAKMEEFLSKEGPGGKVAFVGDGINDTPVIARADIGFAMGAIGSSAAIEAADIVIMDDDIRKIAETKKISKGIMWVARQNIAFALAVKMAVLVLSAFGIANMWIAVFADVGVAMLCILNSLKKMLGKN